LEKEARLHSEERRKWTENGDLANFDTAIVPLVQAGSLGVTQDEKFTLKFLDTFSRPQDVLHLASGYFNLTQQHMAAVTRSSATVKILTASPRANGFFGSRGVSQFVPDGYTCMERKFLKEISKKGREDAVSMHEYFRPGWTFHGKGLWYSEGKDQPPCMTFVGSPNYGQRSSHRDVEAQVMVVTADKDLQERLAKERDSLYQQSSPVTYKDLEKGDRKTPLYLRGAAWVLMPYF